jgi:hypothetical protein
MCELALAVNVTRTAYRCVNNLWKIFEWGLSDSIKSVLTDVAASDMKVLV